MPGTLFEDFCYGAMAIVVIVSILKALLGG